VPQNVLLKKAWLLGVPGCFGFPPSLPRHNAAKSIFSGSLKFLPFPISQLRLSMFLLALGATPGQRTAAGEWAALHLFPNDLGCKLQNAVKVPGWASRRGKKPSKNFGLSAIRAGYGQRMFNVGCSLQISSGKKKITASDGPGLSKDSAGLGLIRQQKSFGLMIRRPGGPMLNLCWGSHPPEKSFPPAADDGGLLALPRGLLPATTCIDLFWFFQGKRVRYLPSATVTGGA